MKKLLRCSGRCRVIPMRILGQEVFADFVFSRFRIWYACKITHLGPSDGDKVALAHRIPVVLLIGIGGGANAPVAIGRSAIAPIEDGSQVVHRNIQESRDRDKTPGSNVTALSRGRKLEQFYEVEALVIGIMEVIQAIGIEQRKIFMAPRQSAYIWGDAIHLLL